MSTSERARLLTVYVGETDQWHHRPLFVEIVHRAHTAGLAGATAIRGFEGYGGTNHIHTVRLLSLSEDLPVAVTIIDTPERIEAFLPLLEEVMTGGMATLEDVEVLHYSSQTPPHRFSWGLGASHRQGDLTAST
jgi:PII-like signaling protein